MYVLDSMIRYNKIIKINKSNIINRKEVIKPMYKQHMV